MDRTWSSPRPYRFDDDPPPWREVPSGSMDGVPYAATTTAARILLEGRRGKRAGRSKVQAQRERRNLVVYMLNEIGLTSKDIAETMGIARSHIQTIIADVDSSLRRSH